MQQMFTVKYLILWRFLLRMIFLITYYSFQKSVQFCWEKSRIANNGVNYRDVNETRLWRERERDQKKSRERERDQEPREREREH